MRGVGFSFHLPVPIPVPYKVNVTRDELDALVGQVERLRERYSGELPILLGGEADFIPGQERAVEELAASYPFDYLIGSVHFLDGWPFDQEQYSRRFTETPVEEIYEQISAEGKKQVEWLRQKHKSFTESLIVDADNHDIKSLEDMKKIVERFVKEKEKTPVFRIPFCSMDMDGKECAEKIKAELQMEVRGYSPDEPSPENKKCLICGRPAFLVRL